MDQHNDDGGRLPSIRTLSGGPATAGISPPNCQVNRLHNRKTLPLRRLGRRLAHGGPVLLALFLLLGLTALPAHAASNTDESEICLGCHSDKSMTTKHGKKTVSLYVNGDKFAHSVHAALSCTGCHSDLDTENIPHGKPKPVNCGNCHSDIAEHYTKSLHGRAAAKGDKLAPHCSDCHGNHDIVPVKSRASAVYPLRVPFVCGKCHQEGTEVQRTRHIPEHDILENYTESIHGEALLKKGLVVAANCASCHTAHDILPPTDSHSSISRNNIAKTCTKCHSGIEQVHRKIIRGELWEKAPHTLPACVDCHAPHKIRNVYYAQGMADADCQTCHGKHSLKAADGRSMYVNQADLQGSMHARIACAQCHSEVNVSHTRPCAAIKNKVDCTKCHEAVGQDYAISTHGQMHAKNDPNAPFCTECHGTHKVLGKNDRSSPIFSTNVPTLCARCHREGEKAAIRYTGTDRDIIQNYTESIHGKGLLQSGLTVTATCTSCHTAHRELPKTDPRSSVYPKNIPDTCGQCHNGIEKQFENSVHSASVTHTDLPLPVCNDCHSAHTIQRTDITGFKLEIMTKCGRCHKDQADTYFDTYHGKVSRLGYAKTAKCYDCHGAHDILKVSDPRSHLSPANVVATCHKCHEGATRRFAGYLTHATHHDPEKYAVLYWVFWAMTGLLIGTFIIGGAHTLLWMPRAFQMRRELREEEAREAAEDAAREAAERAAKEKGDSDVK
jgi:hypothetical protein